MFWVLSILTSYGLCPDGLPVKWLHLPSYFRNVWLHNDCDNIRNQQFFLLRVWPAFLRCKKRFSGFCDGRPLRSFSAESTLMFASKISEFSTSARLSPTHLSCVCPCRTYAPFLLRSASDLFKLVLSDICEGSSTDVRQDFIDSQRFGDLDESDAEIARLH